MNLEINLPLRTKYARIPAYDALFNHPGVSHLVARYAVGYRVDVASCHAESPLLLARLTYTPGNGYDLMRLARWVCEASGSPRAYVLVTDLVEGDDELPGAVLGPEAGDAQFRADRFIRFDDPRFSVSSAQLENTI